EERVPSAQRDTTQQKHDRALPSKLATTGTAYRTDAFAGCDDSAYSSGIGCNPSRAGRGDRTLFISAPESNVQRHLLPRYPSRRSSRPQSRKPHQCEEVRAHGTSSERRIRSE